MKKKTYRYVIELTKPVWPRHIADELTGRSGKVRNADLISVKDLQYKKHIYGDTYQVRPKKPRNWLNLARQQLIGK